MKTTTTLLSLCAAVALLSGCESARKAFSSEKTAPDEFAVYSRPPLSLPPEYRLRPPTPGVVQPGESPTRIAEQAILKNSVKTASPKTRIKGSAGLQTLLRDTGALTASSEIRALIEQESSIISRQDQAFVDKLIFWVDEEPYQGVVVDAEKEQKRIQKNQALGKPVTEGQTPEIKRKRQRKGLLDF